MNPLVIAAGAAALLMFNKSAQAAAPSRQVAVRKNPGQDYATPTGVAGDLARLVNITIKGLASPKSSTATGTVEAARDAVRSGDPYYSGTQEWFRAATLPAANAGVVVPGWSSGSVPGVNWSSSSAFGAFGSPLLTEGDTIPAAPMYSPAADVDVLAAYGW